MSTESIASREVRECVWLPSNIKGAQFTLLAAGSTGIGVALAASTSWIAWLIGQGLLGLGFLQWFILLHECGHGTLYSSRALNRIVGHLASFFALIPFTTWKYVHALHHRWTGWQDLDPTTEPLSRRERSGIERRLADVLWKYWIPVFAVVYRLNNYWRLPRIIRFARGRRVPLLPMAIDVVLLATAYAFVIRFWGFPALVGMVGGGFLLHLIVQDPLLLSQHTDMPSRLSGGRPVRPFRASEQERFTRSLAFGRRFSYWMLMGFDAHELHHRYPGVPGYHLRATGCETSNEVPWRTWIRAAKRLPGSVFLFGGGAGREFGT